MSYKDPQKRKEYDRMYAKTHPEKIKEKNRRYRERHKEQLKEQRRKYYKKNKEVMRKRHDIWEREHREWRKKYREEHKEYYSKKIKEHYKNKKDMVICYNINYLNDNGFIYDNQCHCPECGRVIKVTQVENHHPNPSNKKFNIAEITSHSYKDGLKELKKTIPICPECHKIITANERNHHIWKSHNDMSNEELIVHYQKPIKVFKSGLKKRGMQSE